MSDVLFWALAALLVASAGGVVLSRNLYRAAYFLAAALVVTEPVPEAKHVALAVRLEALAQRFDCQLLGSNVPHRNVPPGRAIARIARPPRRVNRGGGRFLYLT